MDAQQFAYWLQGFSELHEKPPTPEQWQSIREHLATVFAKVTPGIGIPATGIPAQPSDFWSPKMDEHLWQRAFQPPSRPLRAECNSAASLTNDGCGTTVARG